MWLVGGIPESNTLRQVPFGIRFTMFWNTVRYCCPPAAPEGPERRPSPAAVGLCVSLVQAVFLHLFPLCSTSGTCLGNTSVQPLSWALWEQEGAQHHHSYHLDGSPSPLCLCTFPTCFVREMMRDFALIALNVWDENPVRFGLTHRAHCTLRRTAAQRHV